MQISCPSCKTRISVPDDKIKPEGTKVKCGKCTKIFTVKKKVADTDPKVTAAPAEKATEPKIAVKAPSAFGGESSSELDDLFGDDLGGGSPAPTPAPAPAPPPAPVRERAPAAAPAADDHAGSMLNDPFGASDDTADQKFDTDLGGDNFGADMANFQTQLRPMGGGRNADMFGGSEDLDDNALNSPTRDHGAASMFGSAGDLSDEPAAPPKPEKHAAAPAGDDLDDLFGARDEEPAPVRPSPAKIEPAVRSKPKSVMPPKESLDDLFGKGLDDDNSDDFVNQLRESKPKAKAAAPKVAETDDIFGSNDESPFGKPDPKPAARSAPNKLDSLFDADVEAPRAAPKAKEPARPAMNENKGPTAEELASTMKLEPALKEEDAPKAPPPKAVDTKAAAAKKKLVLPIRAIVYLTLVLMVGGGVAAAVYVPAINKPAAELLKQLPLAQFKELFDSTPKAPPIEVVKVTATVSGGRLLQGGRGDKLYVMEGSARNDYPGSRSFIKVRGVLLDATGNVVATREVFAGNTLNDEEIRGLDRVKIDGLLNRSVGDGLSNFNVPSGNSIPFQIVFYDVETPIATTRIEPVSSEPGN